METNSIKSLLILSFAILAIPGRNIATNYYVDNTVSSSGNGSSWAKAWKNFSNINWGSIKGGDTIYISGGSSSQTYYETLTVGASGTAGNPITITKGIDAGHNGTAILDEQSIRDEGVYSYGHSYLTIQNLSVQNVAADACFVVKYATGGVLVQNNKAYSGMGTGNGADARGYDVRNSSGVIVRHNSYTTPTSTTSQTDGIWSSGNNGVIFDGNTLDVENNDPTGHSDGIQSYLDTSITICNNYVSHPTGGTNNHGMWLTDAYGTITIYNNVVYMPQGDEQAITYWNESGYSGKALMWNNTVYGAYWCYRFISAPNSELKNCVCAWPGEKGFMIEQNSLPSANVDHNLIYSTHADIGYVANNNVTWSGWQSFGYDTHGVNADPKFTNVANQDFSLQGTSPAIDQGMSLPTVTADYSGINRPQGAEYDIGAFEYVSVTGIKEVDAPVSFLIFPNPSSTYFTLRISTGVALKELMLKIYNSTGEEVKNVPIAGYETMIDRKGLPSGLYFYRILNNSEGVASGKLILQ